MFSTFFGTSRQKAIEPIDFEKFIPPPPLFFFSLATSQLHHHHQPAQGHDVRDKEGGRDLHRDSGGSADK